MVRWSAQEPATDTRLVEALAGHDQDALADLYAIYAEPLFDYCWSLLGESGQAAEAVTETMIAAWHQAGDLAEPVRLRPWLYAAARRHCARGGGGKGLFWHCVAASEVSAAEAAERFDAFRPKDANAHAATASGGPAPGTTPRAGMAADAGADAGADPPSAAGADAGAGAGVDDADDAESGGGPGDSTPADGSAPADRYEPPAAGPPATVPPADGGDGGVVDARCERIRRAFVALAPATQEALFLADRHDFDTAGLSAILGSSPRRIEGRLRRGRAGLAAAFPGADVTGLLDRHAAPGLPGGPPEPPEAVPVGDQAALAGGAARTGAIPDPPGAVPPRVRRWLLAVAGAGVAAVVLAAVLVGGGGGGMSGPLGALPFGPPARPSPSAKSSAATGPAVPLVPPERGAGQGATPGRTTAGAPGSASGSASPGESSPPPTSAEPVRLAVWPGTVSFAGSDTTAQVRLRATGEAIVWSATSSSKNVSLPVAEGRLPAGEGQAVRVRLNRTAVTLPGSATVTFVESTGRRHTVRASWSGSVL